MVRPDPFRSALPDPVAWLLGSADKTHPQSLNRLLSLTCTSNPLTPGRGATTLLPMKTRVLL